MKQISKVIALIVLGAILLGVFTGCTPNSTSPTSNGSESNATVQSASSETPAGPSASSDEWYGNADGTPITLKVWGGIQPEYGYDEAIANFNREFLDKGIQAEYVRYVNDPDGNLQVDTYLMSNGEIDVLVGYGAAPLLNRASSGQLLNITDLLAADGFDSEKELGKASMSSYWVDGDQIYGLPTIYSNNRWMMVNVDLFEAAGVPIPYNGWTYAEYLSAAEKLTSGEGPNRIYGGMWCFQQDMVQSLGVISSVLGQHGYYKDLDSTETNFDSEIWVKGMKMVKDSIDGGYAYGLDDEISESLTFANTFLEGKAAISLNISQLRLILDTETYPHEFKTALVPGPVPDESYMTDEYKYHTNYSGTNDLISIAKNSEHPEAGYQFLKWYLTGGMGPLAGYGRIPLWSGFDSNIITSVLADKDKAGILDLDSLDTYLNIDKSAALIRPAFKSYTEIEAILKEEFQNILLGQTSIEQGLASAKSRSDALLA